MMKLREAINKPLEAEIDNQFQTLPRNQTSTENNNLSQTEEL